MKWSIKSLMVAAVLATGAALPASAQNPAQPRRITLEEALQIGLRQNTALQQAENALETSEIAVDQAKYRFLPNLSGSIGTNQQMGRNFSQDEGRIINTTTRSLSTGVSAGVTIFDGLSNVANLRQTRYTAEASDLDLERARETVVFDVLTRYLALVQAREQLAVADQNLATATALEEQVKVFVDANRRPIADLYTQQSAVASARVAQLQARRAITIAELNLVSTLNLDPAGDYEFVTPQTTDSVPALPGSMQELMQHALTNRSDLAAGQARLEASEEAVKVAKAARWPSVSMSAGYNTAASSTSDFSILDQFDQRRGGSVGLSMSIPIFDRFAASANTQRARVQLDNQQITLNNLRQNITLQVRQAYLDLELFREQVAAAEIQLASANLALEAAEQRYRVGAGTLIEVTQARTTQASAQAGLINARYNLLFQTRVLDYYTGALDPQNPAN
ncbi:MAG TPA: TolC family protein [Longimicrobiales bacterium]